MVLLPVLLSFDGGRFGGPGFLVGSHLSRCSSLLPGWGRVELLLAAFSWLLTPAMVGSLRPRSGFLSKRVYGK